MSSTIGFICLSLSVLTNLFLIISSLFFNKNILRFYLLVRASSIFTITSFFALMYAYIISDFSNFNVFQNSHSNKPLIYKISGTWGNHEGSMLLWISILSLYAFLFSYTKNISEVFRRTTILVQLFLHTLFGLFIILTSNPFLVNSILLEEGLGLNPILQDPGLAIHPPVLYAGYVGYSIVFSLAVASLLISHQNNDWIYIRENGH